MTASAVSRRRFNKSVGALTIAFSMAPLADTAEPVTLPGSLAKNRRLNAWLRIDADGTITIFTGKVELGQGILTALRQIAADELDVTPAKIEIVSGDTAQTPDEGFTSGSLSIEHGGAAIRHACVEARAILLALAAEKLGVTPDQLTVVDGAVTSGDKRLSYWEISVEAQLRRHTHVGAAPKPSDRHRLIGKSMPRLDIPAKVTGGASYVQDIRLPGMLFGRILRPPSYHAALVSFDEAQVRKLPGVVTVVRDGRFLGVAAEREEQAIAARQGLARAASWRDASSPSAFQDIYAHLRSLPVDDHVVSRKGGDTPPSVVTSSHRATYTRPYTAHASIGPSCAVARFENGRLTVWTHSQGVFPLRNDLAKALDMDVTKIRCIHAQGSGCYGHNGADDVALDAALLARACNGRPVKVQWMRDDEFGWEPNGPAMIVELHAELGEAGEIVDWSHDVWSSTHTTRPQADGCNLLAAWHLERPKSPGTPEIIPQPAGGGDRNAIPLYDLPRHRVTHHFIRQSPIRVSALRSLGAYANIFAIETFMDDLAKAARVDSVEYRMRHLDDERAFAAIKAAASYAGWQPGLPGGTGRGRGFGFAQYKNSAAYLAVVVEVEVHRRTGEVQVRRVTAAIDAGEIVDPDGLVNQTEGGIVQAISWTLKEQVRFAADRVTSRDWSDYPIIAFPEIPEINVTILDRPGEKSLGAGEAAQGPTAAAIGNAIAHATGVRLRDLPITPDRIKGVFG